MSGISTTPNGWWRSFEAPKPIWKLPSFRGVALSRVLARYHRHRVVRIERLTRLLRKGRRVVLVGNHALDIVDPLLLLGHVYQCTGSVPNFIGHEKGWFRLPLLRDVARHFHVIPTRRPAETTAALRRGGFLMIYPGGMRESGMRSYRDEPYQLKWEGHAGYLRVALEAEAEVVFVAAVGSDEAYYQSRLPTPRVALRIANAGDDQRYRGMRLGFGMAGAHVLPGIFPLPVRITHFVSPPIDLGDRTQALRDRSALEDLHQRVWGECQSFLDTAVARRGRYSDRLDRAIRSGQQRLQQLGV